MADEFLYTSTTDIRAVPLIEALTIEYDTRYGNYFSDEGAAAEMNKYPPEAFAPPHGNFLLLLRDGQTIGGGAFMRYDDVTAEFKRIWTHSNLRRQGLAKRVLEELEAQAHRQGYKRVYLTTGFRQPEAKELYLRNGYTALFDVSADPEVYGTLPFEKSLHNIHEVDFHTVDNELKKAASG
ncbi:N-acetyltransferase [Ochrobactrum sp. MYb15]|uniref:GNAT family N-acetyltransferase n=1 Tax=Brucella TaxID=234 RepID=UPI0004635186|nr:GNAT family N-acetyltransferase [Brucella rhizosphaerae]PQZ50505.1 N-acetyltransferase [Ochrobactrum sp. MYb19]PRA68544.1 N-acetyltransferase [Ochrobactrum sp. MYb18]PRA74228.1 N-acetyltransferase [Brucella thiophenivorans]PRA90796.1 N-acetyltransferase [Ochrobactrum sp. MYb14]PRA96247.1 N-acetyltransferase [Ochrobactrum sp. MYb15]